MSGTAIRCESQMSGSDPYRLALRPGRPTLRFAPQPKQPVESVLLKRWERDMGCAATRFHMAAPGLAVKRSGSRTSLDRVQRGQSAGMLEIPSFLSAVYSRSARGQPRQAAAKVMEYVDDLLREGEFSACRRLLEKVDVPRLKDFPAVLLAFLGITLAAREKLSSSRERFWGRVKAMMAQELGLERAHRILSRFQ